MTTRPMVIVDYGHGGVDRGQYRTPGKQYTYNDGFWIGEGIVNRMIAARFMGRLCDRGLAVYDCVAGRVVLGRPTWLELEQTDVPLAMRVAAANSVQSVNGSPLVSIHANAIGNASTGAGHAPRGMVLYTSPGETQSDSLATFIREAVADDPSGLVKLFPPDLSDGDIDYERRFTMLTKTVGPAVLVESSFFTNREDANMLISRRGQRAIAAGLVAGVCRWLDHTNVM